MSERQHHIVAVTMPPDLDSLFDRTIEGEDVKIDFKSGAVVFHDQTELCDRLKAAGYGVHFFGCESGGAHFQKVLVGARLEAAKRLSATQQLTNVKADSGTKINRRQLEDRLKKLHGQKQMNQISAEVT